MKKTTTRILIIIATIFIFALIVNPLYILTEGNQVVITRFGQIVASTSSAGLHVKIPFVDTITTYPKKVMAPRRRLTANPDQGKPVYHR